MGPVKVVIRYANGDVLKGYTNDFFPNKLIFHVGASPAERGMEVSIGELKAVFFVKDFEGNRLYDEKKEFDQGQVVHGRKTEVLFKDGEVMVGTVLGYDPKRSGFILIPSDRDSNNTRVFIINAATREVKFI